VIFIENVADDANALRESGGALAEEWVGHGGRRKMRPQEAPYVWCPLSSVREIPGIFYASRDFM
jgi:hypothetical protein